MRILQCLNWDLTAIKNNLKKIKEQGFDVIQITPVQPLKESHKNSWWLCYQPCGFSIGNQYGSREDLLDLCNNAHEYGLSIVVDVIRHIFGVKKEIYKVIGKIIIDIMLRIIVQVIYHI